MKPLRIRTRLMVFWMTALAAILVTFSAVTCLLFNHRLRTQARSGLDQSLQLLLLCIDSEDGGLEWRDRIAAIEHDAQSPLHKLPWVISLSVQSEKKPVLIQASRKWQRSGLGTDMILDDHFSEMKGYHDPFLLAQARKSIRLDSALIAKLKGEEKATTDALSQRIPAALNVTAGYALENDNHTMLDLAGILAFTSLVVWGVMLVGSVYLTRRAMAPLTHLAAQAKNIGGDSREARLQLPGATSRDDEIALLTDAFNSCLQRLEISLQQQKRFTADASHELRTPLSIISGEIEVALRRPRTAEELRHVLERSSKQAQRLTQLVEKLLLLSRAQEQQVPLEPLQVQGLLEDLEERWCQHARWKDMLLTVQPPANKSSICVHKALFEAAVDNLIDNAAKYSPPGSPLKIEVRLAMASPAATAEQESCVMFAIEDAGPGLEQGDISHLFEAFYRGEKARSSEQPGAGLGLSIVRRAAAVCHANVKYTPGPQGKGAIFSILFPAAIA